MARMATAGGARISPTTSGPGIRAAGELVEETSGLTGGSWTASARYLRAGGGCSSLLIRMKTATDDEYHHGDLVGAFGVITDANAVIMSSNIYNIHGVNMYISGNAITDHRFLGNINSCRVYTLENIDMIFLKDMVVLVSRSLMSINSAVKKSTGCELYKNNPNQTSCQDCCDDALIGWAKKHWKNIPKNLLKCMAHCENKPPEDQEGCLRDCFDDGGPGWNVNFALVRQYLTCCYLACENPDPKQFMPPGHCALKLGKASAD